LIRRARELWFDFVMIAAGASLGAGAAGCYTSGCLADCYSTIELELNSPIGQPGDYDFIVGSHRCSLRLPSTGASCAVVQDFSVVGLRFTDPQPPRELPVTIIKDGVQVVNTRAVLKQYLDAEECGSTCHKAIFSMDVPPELAPPIRLACDQAGLTGVYTVVESSHTGGCQSLFDGATIILENGLLDTSQSGCSSQLTEWSSSKCEMETSRTCSSEFVNTTWSVKLTDVFGDGSTLIGTGSVSVSAGAKCTAEAGLELVRR
jgi:hypothetical protein